MNPLILVGIAFFILAFIGINKLGHTILGLVAVIGLLFGAYFIWQGLTGGNQNAFGWGCILLIGGAGFLVFLKTISGD
ncbi:MAG TPA: hypothetical protein VFN35_14640 [Ktedonobacteraceae bacterium]|nr:hypothetical protein [Ktedonobacteraceae bacterium]